MTFQSGLERNLVAGDHVRWLERGQPHGVAPVVRKFALRKLTMDAVRHSLEQCGPGAARRKLAC